VPASAVRAIEVAPLRIESEKRNTERICAVLSFREYAAGQEDQWMSPVTSSDGLGLLD